MKKIIALVLTITIMMSCQVYAAFKEPDSTRWVAVGFNPTNNMKFWFDVKTLRYEKKYGDICANFWAMSNIPGHEDYAEVNWEINMNKREITMLSFVNFEENGKVTSGKPSPRTEAIAPGTLFETLYDAVTEIYKEYPDIYKVN